MFLENYPSIKIIFHANYEKLAINQILLVQIVYFSIFMLKIDILFVENLIKIMHQ